MNTKIKKIYPIFAILLFILITLVIMFSRTPFWDEAHQIDIARLKITEILSITKVIGHPFLWYFLIKPFSNPHLYPYNVYLINWFFCLFAIIILWKKSPFNLLIKTLITFSAPFVFYFATVGRCYGIGILLLFLLCALYPVKHKHPYKYSFLVILASNTSAMVMIGCFYLGLLFLYDLIKRKNKELKNILIILLIFALLTLIQYMGAEKPYKVDQVMILTRMFYYVILPLGLTAQSFILHLFSSLMFYIFPFYCFKKSKEALFFISGTFITLSAIFIFEYSGNYWNHYFYYIYLIITFWLFYKKLYKNKFIKISFIMILSMFCFKSAALDNVVDFPYSSHSKEIAQVLEKYKDYKLVVIDAWSDTTPGADIFLAKNNIDLYDIHSRKRTSYECQKDIYALDKEVVDFDNLYNQITDNGYLLAKMDLTEYKYKDSYVIKKENDYIVQTKDEVYYLKNIENKPLIELFMYKPIKITSYGKIVVWK